MGMKTRIQVVIVHEDDDEIEIVEVAGCLQQGGLLGVTPGMTLM